MACGTCGGRGRQRCTWVWTSAPDGDGHVDRVVYASEVAARAKAIRAGGSFTCVPQGG